MRVCGLAIIWSSLSSGYWPPSRYRITSVSRTRRRTQQPWRSCAMAATSQQLHYVDQNAYASNATDLEAYGFRQGAQVVTVEAADASTYCMEAPGGGGTFRITHDTGRPEAGTC